MLAVFGVLGIAGGTCLACATTETRFERQIDIASGLLLVAGLSMVGMMLAVVH